MLSFRVFFAIEPHHDHQHSTESDSVDSEGEFQEGGSGQWCRKDGGGGGGAKEIVSALA